MDGDGAGGRGCRLALGRWKRGWRGGVGVWMLGRGGGGMLCGRVGRRGGRGGEGGWWL